MLCIASIQCYTVLLQPYCLYSPCSAVIGCIIAPLHSMLILSTSYSTVPYSVLTVMSQSPYSNVTDPHRPHNYPIYFLYSTYLLYAYTRAYIGLVLSWVPLLYMPIVLLLLLLLIAYGHSYRDSFINSPSLYYMGHTLYIGVVS